MSVPGIAADPEFRGMWATRFEWPNSNVVATQTNINTIFTKLQQHRFNAVMFQVRGQMDTLYPSPDEPWSPIVSANGLSPAGWGTFDPLSFAVNAAHTRGLELHAYINTHVCWQSASALRRTTPRPTAQAAPLLGRTSTAADPAHRDWMIHDIAGHAGPIRGKQLRVARPRHPRLPGLHPPAGHVRGRELRRGRRPLRPHPPAGPGLFV